MGQKLILSDGTELEDSYVIYASGTLWVYVYAQISFAALFALLNNPDKTAAITLVRGENDEEDYDGFTDLFVLRKEDGGFISGGLRKEQ